MKLPKFNKEITVTVDVDQIFNRLVDTFPADYKHKELVSHAIVGTAINSEGIGYVYNALNGYSPELDFVIGDTVICSEKHRRVCTRNEDGSWNKDWAEIGECVVVDIDYYAKDKLKVQYQQHGYNTEEMEITTASVDHKKCTKVAIAVP